MKPLYLSCPQRKELANVLKGVLDIWERVERGSDFGNKCLVTYWRMQSSSRGYVDNSVFMGSKKTRGYGITLDGIQKVGEEEAEEETHAAEEDEEE